MTSPRPYVIGRGNHTPHGRSLKKKTVTAEKKKGAGRGLIPCPAGGSCGSCGGATRPARATGIPAVPRRAPLWPIRAPCQRGGGWLILPGAWKTRKGRIMKKQGKVQLAVPVTAAEKATMAAMARREGKSLTAWAAGAIRAAWLRRDR